MVAWFALVAADCAFAIDVFPSRDQAEEALADALADEPGFADLLSVVEIELTGSAAVAERSAC